mmetsp:Transcript_28786/g.67965  ORF Transcript_28786/g.67965 Transcript_28786/m.67965 type:complete len:202 (+) Transcript_28786:1057-1662(+)
MNMDEAEFSGVAAVDDLEAMSESDRIFVDSRRNLHQALDALRFLPLDAFRQCLGLRPNLVLCNGLQRGLTCLQGTTPNPDLVGLLIKVARLLEVSRPQLLEPMREGGANVIVRHLAGLDLFGKCYLEHVESCHDANSESGQLFLALLHISGQCLLRVCQALVGSIQLFFDLLQTRFDGFREVHLSCVEARLTKLFEGEISL